MKSEIKTPLILGILILAGVVILSLSLSLLDSQPQTITDTSESKISTEQKINKLGYKKALN
jgi:hypothetical protein